MTGAALTVFLTLLLVSAAPAASPPQRDVGPPVPFALPFVQLAELSASDGHTSAYYGGDVVLAGTTAFVSAFWHAVDGDDNAGAVYVYERSGPSWEQVRVLTASDGAAGDTFGRSLAVSGTTAVIGAPGCDVDGRANQGAAYVFTRGGTGWVQKAKLTAADGGADDRFGFGVDVDGGTIAAGALRGGPSDEGAAYVFTGSGASWTERARILHSDGGAGDEFGSPVVLQGTTLVVGDCLQDVGGAADQGAVYVYTGSGATWTPQATLTAHDGAAQDQFGIAADLFGSTLVVGANFRDVGGDVDQGAAYVFTRADGAWSQRATLTEGEGEADDSFGRAVSLTRGAVLIGAFYHRVAGTPTGAAHLFTGSGDSWQLSGELSASDGAHSDQFGMSVSLDGETALVGAPTDDTAGPEWGAAYLFDVGSAPTTKATSASVAKGRTVRLRYLVTDAVPTSGSCVVTLEIMKRGKVVKRIPLGVRKMNVTQRYGYTAKLDRGSYTWRVRAIDLARHRSVVMTPAKLTVK